MCTCTPVYGLAMVEGSDRPCDVNDCLCAFAEGVETQLDALDAVVARTATTVPILRIAQTVPRVITSANDDDVIVEFDTVFVDTDNMFNANSSATRFTINTAGMYNFTFNFRATSTGGGNQTSIGGAIFTTPGPTGFGSNFRPVQDNRQNQTGQPMYMSAASMAPLTVGAVSYFELLLLVQGADTISFDYVEVAVHWLGDLV